MLDVDNRTGVLVTVHISQARARLFTFLKVHAVQFQLFVWFDSSKSIGCSCSSSESSELQSVRSMVSEDITVVECGMLVCCVVQRQELCCNVKSCIVVQAGCVWLFLIGGGRLLTRLMRP